MLAQFGADGLAQRVVVFARERNLGRDAYEMIATLEQRDELERLQALAAVNPNIRAEEIEYRKNFAAELLAHIEHTQLKLDAVRVGLAT